MAEAERDWDASRAAVAILRADSRVAQALERALAHAGLTLPQFNVLMELAAARDVALPLYELNARLATTPPNMSWLAGRLEDRRLVTKERADNDSRVVILRLTDEGWNALGAAAPLVFAREKELFGSYAREELKQLAALLARLVDA